MRIPTDREIRTLHQRYAPTQSAFELVHTHCEIVAAVAVQLLSRLELDTPVDTALVRAGCLLHDLGVYRLYRPSGELDHAAYIRHGVLGRDLLRALGYPEPICRFCSCHIGVGLTRDDVVRQRLPLPVEDYLPLTTEEELVTYADTFHSKSDPPTLVSSPTYAARIEQFGPDTVERYAALVSAFGLPDLEPLSVAYGQAIV